MKDKRKRTLIVAALIAGAVLGSSSDDPGDADQ